MTTEATGAPAATETTAAPSAASVAGSALFGGTEAPAASAAAAAPAAGTEAPVALTPEEQAAKDLADAEAAKNDPPAVKRPGKDATPEEWSAFYKSIGAPEAATDYEVTLPEGDDVENTARIQELFKAADILPEQAAKLLEFRNKMFVEQNAAAAAAEEARLVALDNKNKTEAAELTNEWGAASTANMELARRGVTQFIAGDQNKQMQVIASMESVLGYKETMKFWQNIGKSIGEHDAPGLGSNNEQKQSQKSAAEVLYGNTAQK